MRQRHSELREHVLGQPRSVEARGARAAKDVGHAEEPLCHEDGMKPGARVVAAQPNIEVPVDRRRADDAPRIRSVDHRIAGDVDADVVIVTAVEHEVTRLELSASDCEATRRLTLQLARQPHAEPRVYEPGEPRRVEPDACRAPSDDRHAQAALRDGHRLGIGRGQLCRGRTGDRSQAEDEEHRERGETSEQT